MSLAHRIQNALTICRLCWLQLWVGGEHCNSPGFVWDCSPLMASPLMVMTGSKSKEVVP